MSFRKNTNSNNTQEWFKVIFRNPTKTQENSAKGVMQTRVGLIFIRAGLIVVPGPISDNCRESNFSMARFPTAL